MNFEFHHGLLGENLVFNPTVIVVGDRLAMIYRCNAKGPPGSRLQLAFSEDGRNFTPYPSNPVMVPDGPFDDHGCEDPRVVEFNGTYFLLRVSRKTSRGSYAIASAAVKTDKSLVSATMAASTL